MSGSDSTVANDAIIPGWNDTSNVNDNSAAYSDRGWDYTTLDAASNTNNTITPGQMSVGATSWDGVIANGISRVFDIAGRISLAKNVPYYQTSAGQTTMQSQQMQRTMLLAFAGIAVLMVLRGR